MIEQFRSCGLGAFWARGQLSALDRACLATYLNFGCDLTLYSYEPVANVPDGVKKADAALIVPEAMLDRVMFNGRPDLAHFSDIFRYAMIRQTGEVWVDVDLMMIADVPVPVHDNIIVLEEQGGINGALLHVADGAIMDELDRIVQTKLDRELRWGETGPMVIRDALRGSGVDAELYHNRYFYPVEHYDIWKVFLPDEYDLCAEQCSQAATLHLFNNILGTMGYWKELAPPEGSYLHTILKRQDLLHLFSGTYPEKIMKACVENFRFRQNGKALGIGSIVREIVPSVGRTYRHYCK